MAVIPQHQDAQGLEEETPHHAESIGFAQQVDIAAAQQYGGDLEDRNQVDHPVGRAEAALGFAEPIEENPVLGDPVHDAVGADNRCVHGA